MSQVITRVILTATADSLSVFTDLELGCTILTSLVHGSKERALR